MTRTIKILRPISHNDLVDETTYFVIKEGFEIAKARYTEQDNGNMWLFIDGPLEYGGTGGDNGGYMLKPSDKVFLVPPSENDKPQEESESSVDIEELFKIYQDARHQISEFFDDMSCAWNNMVINLESKWTDYGEKYRRIGWDIQTADESSPLAGNTEAMYEFSICHENRWEKQGLVVFVGRDGGGNTDTYIFKAENKVEIEP